MTGVTRPRPGSRRRRVRPGPRSRGAAAACVSLAVAAAACTATVTAPPAPAAGSVASVPLTAASTGTGAGWATLAMGRLADPLNTFWQLFYRSPHASTWQLDTPPGVASNGGLATSVSGSGTVLAGFGASLDLRFSPLAISSDQGLSWTGGVLSWALARVPDSLAVSDTGQELALVAGGQQVGPLGGTSGGVVSGSGGQAAWTGVVSTAALAADPAASACRVRAITAVAYRPGGTGAVVGALCARSGRVGIFEQDGGGGWVSVGPVLAGAAGTQVVRLEDTAAGLSALVRTGSGNAARLAALWGSGAPGSAWTASGALTLGGAALRSTATTPTGGFVILTAGSHAGAGGRRSAAVADPASRAWQTLPAPPGDAASVVATPSGGFDALAPDGSTLVVDSLAGGSWRRTQSIDVPIQYGSSG